MTWFYSKDGRQMGPVAEQELVSKVKSGELSQATLVWKEGMSEWMPLGAMNLPALVSMSSMPSSGQGNVMMQQPPMSSYPPVRPKIPTYLWQSIVVTLLCCLPFGVVAIVYASKVDSLLAVGDYVGAKSASDSARTWVIVSAGMFLLSLVGYIALVLIASLAP